MSGRYDDDEEVDEVEDDDLHDEEDEEEDEDEEDEEDEDEEDEDEADVEREFREQRARVRATVDLDDLRQMRANLRHAVSAGAVRGASRIRATDLIELIDDRITDLRAKQLADRRS